MKQLIATVLSVTIAASSSGCASVISGKHDDVQIRSNPPGAVITVDGTERGETPAKISLKRKIPHTVTLSKEGFAEETLSTRHGFNWWVLIDAVWGIFAFFPIIFDMGTGAAYNVSPAEIDVDLEKTDPNHPSARASAPAVPAGTVLSEAQQKKIDRLEKLKKDGVINADDYKRLMKETLARR